jgi:hypothetical protein
VRIALRKSGGRGEYELAGRQGEVGADALLDRNLRFELTPEITIDGHSSVQRKHGKTRIRLDSQKYSHAYIPLAGALLLPKPRRELRETGTDPDLLHDGRFAVTDIDVDVVEVAAATATLRPTVLWLGNAAGLARPENVADRMSRVQAVWAAAKGQGSPLAELVLAHEQATVEGDHREIPKAARALQKKLGANGDPLPQLAVALGLEAEIETEVEAEPSGSAAAAAAVAADEEEIDPADAARRAVSRWRKSVVRTAAGRAFSQKVRVAYGFRCALSGDVLPKLPNTTSPGVDGAHILPWARYELNTVSNGICLNKLCHWAFDAGVLRIDHDASSDRYVVSIPDAVRHEGSALEISLEYFDALQGPIPVERLPSDRRLWPSPTYLERLNSELFG